MLKYALHNQTGPSLSETTSVSLQGSWFEMKIETPLDFEFGESTAMQNRDLIQAEMCFLQKHHLIRLDTPSF